MTRRRKPNEQGAGHRGPNIGTPSQEDEADILAEVGGERDESGELLVNEETVREIGAVDAASVRENRRMKAALDQKQGGVLGIVFNTDDLLTKYEQLIKEWPPNTLDISVTRRTGTPIKHTILSRPRSGVELYNAIKEIHGQNAEAQYEVKFLDSNQKVYRGTGQITMPDARPSGQQGQPMTYPPNGYPQAPPGYPPQQQQAAPAAQAPVAQTAPQPDPMAMMGQMFELFQRMQAMQSQQSRPQVPSTIPAPSSQAPADPMAMMSQMFEVFQRMQGQAVSTVPQAAPQIVLQPPPPSSPQQSPAVDPMTMMSQMFDMFMKMQERTRDATRPYLSGTAGARPLRDGPPPYSRSFDPNPPPPPPPQRQLTPLEQFRESMTFVRTATDAVQEMRSMFPEQGQQETPYDDDDDNPVRVFEAGPAKIIVDKKDGTLRKWETGWANLGGVLKWVGEQREAIQKEAAARQERQQPRQQLAPGYVEVGPGYVPPPGYRAVRVEPQEQQQEQSPLPPPPAYIPPPIQETPAPSVGWGAPPEDQGENR